MVQVELDRTLCMNRIAQLEEELDSLKEAKADAMTDARLNNEFLGRGFSDLQVRSWWWEEEEQEQERRPAGAA